jgi:hypothetical protein
MKYAYLALAFIAGWAAGMYFHPYEQCARMYNSPEYIGECVWIKEN